MIDKRMTKPKKGYVIFAEHRSGSTLLCEMLLSTGSLGCPDEVFRNNELSVDIEKNPDLFSEILESVTTRNGIYGLKVFSNQFDITMKTKWLESLENPVFIYLERRDILAQAISFVKAIQTNQYFSTQAVEGRVRYDAKLIASNLARIADAGARWRRYFARNGISPIWLVYEEMIEDPDRAVAQIAKALGVECPILRPERLSLSIQRDELNAEWRRRFVEEKGDRSYLDATLGPSRTIARRFARDIWYFTRKIRR